METQKKSIDDFKGATSDQIRSQIKTFVGNLNATNHRDFSHMLLTTFLFFEENNRQNDWFCALVRALAANEHKSLYDRAVFLGRVVMGIRTKVDKDTKEINCKSDKDLYDKLTEAKRLECLARLANGQARELEKEMRPVKQSKGKKDQTHNKFQTWGLEVGNTLTECLTKNPDAIKDDSFQEFELELQDLLARIKEYYNGLDQGLGAVINSTVVDPAKDESLALDKAS